MEFLIRTFVMFIFYRVKSQTVTDLDYEKDENQAIHRLEMEISVKNNSSIRYLQTILNKINESQTNISDVEKQNLIKFFSQISIFKENVKDIQEGGSEFKKI